MTPLKPWFWPQSQTSYGRMYTRMGSFDFATKLKITPQTLMPGFGPFYRSILLKGSCEELKNKSAESYQFDIIHQNIIKILKGIY